MGEPALIGLLPPVTDRVTTRPADHRLRLPASERLRVNEIYRSLQGESTQAGRPCVFVRLTGCQMRCVWCDSEHSFYDGDWMSVGEIIERVRAMDCPLVEVTGGEPLLQPGALTLMTRLVDAGCEVMLETGGGLPIDAVDPRVRRILDVKCPASGEADNNHWPNLDLLTDRDEVKFVVADRADFEWAVQVIDEHDLTARCPVLLSAVEDDQHGVAATDLADWILQSGLPVRLQVQLHKTLWGGARGT